MYAAATAAPGARAKRRISRKSARGCGKKASGAVGGLPRGWGEETLRAHTHRQGGERRCSGRARGGEREMKKCAQGAEVRATMPKFNL